MLTQCPQCKTVFRLRKEQLGAAGGKVRCGQCHTVFDASRHLVGEAPPPPDASIAAWSPAAHEPATPAPPAPHVAVPAEPVAPAEPAARAEPPKPAEPMPLDDDVSAHQELSAHLDALFENTGETTVAATPAPADEPFGETQIETLLTPSGAADSESLELPWDRAPEAIPATERNVDPQANDLAYLAIDEGGDGIAEFDLPEQELTTALPIMEDEDDEATAKPELPHPFADAAPLRHGPGGWATLGWSVAIVLLLATLAGQYAYVNNADLIRYPQLRPALEQLCRYTDCALPPRRDVKAITLLERDIRSSDKYQGILVITATLVNRAPFAQPYPDVEVSMRDVDGNVVASRLFHPAEYLPGGRPRGLLASQATTQLKLDVTDPGPAAVGFEFTFY